MPQSCLLVVRHPGRPWAGRVPPRGGRRTAVKRMFVAPDPGRLRLRNATRAVIGVAAAVAVSELCGLSLTASITAGLAALLALFTVTDATVRDQRITTVLLPIAGFPVLALATTLHGITPARDAAFLAVVFCGVYARRSGPAGARARDLRVHELLHHAVPARGSRSAARAVHRCGPGPLHGRRHALRALAHRASHPTRGSPAGPARQRVGAAHHPASLPGHCRLGTRASGRAAALRRALVLGRRYCLVDLRQHGFSRAKPWSAVSAGSSEL
ncbi:hypothetical protein SPURM210S_08531 [Streptomyces purpurascens]